MSVHVIWLGKSGSCTLNARFFVWTWCEWISIPKEKMHQQMHRHTWACLPGLHEGTCHWSLWWRHVHVPETQEKSLLPFLHLNRRGHCLRHTRTFHLHLCKELQKQSVSCSKKPTENWSRKGQAVLYLKVHAFRESSFSRMLVA